MSLKISLSIDHRKVTLLSLSAEPFGSLLRASYWLGHRWQPVTMSRREQSQPGHPAGAGLHLPGRPSENSCMDGHLHLGSGGHSALWPEVLNSLAVSPFTSFPSNNGGLLNMSRNVIWFLCLLRSLTQVNSQMWKKKSLSHSLREYICGRYSHQASR